MDAIDEVLNARSADELFPRGEDPKAYRKLLRNVHPDRNAGRSADATKATIRLRELYALLGTPASTGATLPVFNVRGTSYAATREWAVSDGMRYYEADESIISVTDADAPWAMKGVETITTAIRDMTDHEKNFFMPEKAHTRVIQPGGKSLVTVYEPLETDFLTYGDVLKRLPEGIGPKHLAWMFRRLLVALGSLHETGVSHNSIDQDSVLIHPELHGVVLKDYQFSTQFGERVTAVSKQALGRLSPRFHDVKSVENGGEDLALAARLMEDGFGRQSVPMWFSRFFNYVRRAQPSDAAELLSEFDEILEEHWGKRKFVPFHVPSI